MADFRHLPADIGRFLLVTMCSDEANIALFRGLERMINFGTVVALAVYPQGFVKLPWRIRYERQAEGAISFCFNLFVHHFLNRSQFSYSANR